jgi:hypothetical protein
VDVPARIERSKYFRELDYLELSALFAGPMRPSSIAQWTECAPAGTLGIVAPFSLTHRRAPRAAKLWPHDSTTGDFRSSAVSGAVLPVVRDDAARLRARAVVFRAPDQFSPSAANRELLRRFFGDIATPDALGADVQRVWVPGGLWEVRPAVRFAAELGVTGAFDPLVRDPAEPPEIYYELEASSLYFRIEGTRAGALRGERLADLALLAEHYAAIDLTIAFATAERWHDARSLKKLLST